MKKDERKGLGTRAAGLGVAAVVLLASACASGPPQPAPLDTRTTECAHCRMIVSDAHYAAQIVAPGEEPRFFDDVGCLRDYLKEGAGVASDAVAYVADHRNGEWTMAAEAVYTKAAGVSTPMASGLIAHANAASREADAAAGSGHPVGMREIFGPNGAPKGR